MNRKLKLPDGGTLDMPIPPDFGSPVFAMNGAGDSTPIFSVFGKPEAKMVLVGAIAGALIAAAVIYYGKRAA